MKNPKTFKEQFNISGDIMMGLWSLSYLAMGWLDFFEVHRLNNSLLTLYGTILMPYSGYKIAARLKGGKKSNVSKGD